MTKIMKILLVPIDAIGHLMAAIGMAEVLISSGHTVVFAINEQWKARLNKYVIQEVLLTQEDRPSDEYPAKRWSDLFVSGGGIIREMPFETALTINTKLMPYFAEEVKRLDRNVEQLLEDIKSDVVVLDQVLAIPSVILSGIPWVLVCSFNPITFIDDDRTPPWGSGLPSKGKEVESKKYREQMNEAIYPIWQTWNKYILSRGLPPLKTNNFRAESEFPNIYGFPLELDYLDIRPLPPKWYRFDNLKRTDKHLEFELPEKLRGKEGKLVYFSLGSMGGADVDLMKRLAILSKCEHRFIVSMGVLHDQYELGDNMWGQPSVPQIQVLSSVDLVITHGGH